MGLFQLPDLVLELCSPRVEAIHALGQGPYRASEVGVLGFEHARGTATAAV